MIHSNRILIVEDQPRERDALARLLRTEGYQTLTAGNAAEALRHLDEPVGLVICDVRLGNDNGVDLLKQWKQVRAGTPFVMVTAFGEVQSAVTAIKLGAEEYLTKPLNPDELLVLIRRLLKRQPDSRSSAPDAELEGPLGRILGRSDLMADVHERIRRAAQVNSLVLVLGESGTGKELVASAVHELSPRKSGPYIAVNIAAVPESLVEAELFGSVAGAYTGAVQNRAGRFEAAHGGTLFIDEIGDFPLAAQTKLLRVLEDLTITPVGSNEERKVDVRVVAATSRNLHELVASGEFREDLFYRLNVLTIQLPPLRERRDDLPELIDAFLAHGMQKHQRPQLVIAPELRDFLMKYQWPGNVRELRNMIENLIVMSRGDVLTLQDLPDYLLNSSSLASKNEPETLGSLQDLERSAVIAALEHCRGNRTKAAESLGISVRTLQRKLKAWGPTSGESPDLSGDSQGE
jgi:two-component system, NtrC family, response regulator HydG